MNTVSQTMTLRQAHQYLVGSELIAADHVDEPITRFVSDSRQVAAGDLFIAIRGEKFDAHQFLDDVKAKGVHSCLISSKDQLPKGLAAVVVDDTVQAMQKLARAWSIECQKQGLSTLVVVVGSNGKTTVKGMIASLFEAAVGKEHVLSTLGNFNNEIGLPLTLLRLKKSHQLAVVELGMNHPGETRLLADIAQANVLLINNAQREHQEFMESVEAVAQEHALAIESLPDSGVLVIPADSEYFTYWKSQAQGRQVVSFALQANADATVCGQWHPEAGALHVQVREKSVHIKLQVLGEHNAKNALAAVAVGVAVGLPLEKIKEGLEEFQAVDGRMQLLWVDSVKVINDTYNANPDSVRAAIDVLAGEEGVKCLVLGDMGEVGQKGPEYHVEVGAYAASRGIDYLLTLGELSFKAHQAFIQASKTDRQSALHCQDIQALNQAMKDEVQKLKNTKAAILVKGSRFMRMERVLDALGGTTTHAREVH